MRESRARASDRAAAHTPAPRAAAGQAGATDPSAPGAAELTLRGILLGAAITVVFMAANVYVGLRTGVTFASSIPAAVISMSVLRLSGPSGILENNIVQTQASAAGTLCNVILVLPALVLVGHWAGFPFWQTPGVCLLGGLLGVAYSIPLRRALVTRGDLPFPEGTAAAEVLRAGHAEEMPHGAGTGPRLRDLVGGGLASAAIALATGGFRLLGEGVVGAVAAGGAVFRLGTGFSLALVGIGYLVGVGACLALLLGVALAWGVAVPALTALGPPVPPGEADAAALSVWSGQVRLIGAGIIAVGAAWTVVSLGAPIADSVRSALAAHRPRAGAAPGIPRGERDLPITWVALGAGLLSLPLAGLLAWFASGAGLGVALLVLLAVGAALFVVLFGFLMAAVCGYLAGLLGSSSSPISGIGILSTMLTAALLGLALGGEAEDRFVTGTALFVSAIVVAIASIANDNLQDLKTGQLVDATPWCQQVALLLGALAGAAVIAPLLELLYQAYGFVGAPPRPDMAPGDALAAPQAALMAQIARGIVRRELPWTMILTGAALGVALVALEARLRRRGSSLPALTVGIGMYLPPTAVVTIAIGGVLGWLGDRAIRRGGGVSGNAAARAEAVRKRGVLVASGFLVGESFVGVGLAGIDALAGRSGSLSLVGAGFEGAANWLGLGVFGASLLLFYRLVSRPNGLTPAAGGG